MRTSVIGRAGFDEATVSTWVERVEAAIAEVEETASTADALVLVPTGHLPRWTLGRVLQVARRVEAVAGRLDRLTRHAAATKIAQGWKTARPSSKEGAASTSRTAASSAAAAAAANDKENRPPATTTTTTLVALVKEEEEEKKKKKKKKVIKRGVLTARDPNSQQGFQGAPLPPEKAAEKKKAPLRPKATAKSRAAMEKVRLREVQPPPPPLDQTSRPLGGGWCGAGAKQKWMETDEMILKKLEHKKRLEAGDDVASRRGSSESALVFGTPTRSPTSSALREAKKRLEGQASTPARAAAFEAATRAAERWLDEARRGAAKKPRIAELESVVEALQVAKARGESSKPKRANMTLAEARARLRKAIEKLFVGGDAAVELEVERWDQVVRGHPDYAVEQRAARDKWDADQREANEEALAAVRSVVPIDIHAAAGSSSKTKNWSRVSVEAAGVPSAVADRVFKARALWLVRAPPACVAKTHVAVLRTQCNTTNFDVTEQRALYAAVATVAFENDGDGAKEAWRESVRDKLASMVAGGTHRDPRAPWTEVLGTHGPFPIDPAYDADLYKVEANSLEDEAHARKQELDDLTNRADLAATAVAISSAFGARKLPYVPPARPAVNQIHADDPRTAILAAIKLRAPTDHRHGNRVSSATNSNEAPSSHDTTPEKSARLATDDERNHVPDPRTSLLAMIQARGEGC